MRFCVVNEEFSVDPKGVVSVDLEADPDVEKEVEEVTKNYAEAKATPVEVKPKTETRAPLARSKKLQDAFVRALKSRGDIKRFKDAFQREMGWEIGTIEEGDESAEAAPPASGASGPAASGAVSQAQHTPHVTQMFIMSMMQVYARNTPTLHEADLADGLEWKRVMCVDSPCHDVRWYDHHFNEEEEVKNKLDTKGSYQGVTYGIVQKGGAHLAICPQSLIRVHVEDARKHLYKIHRADWTNKLVNQISHTMSYLLRHAKPSARTSSLQGGAAANGLAVH